MNSKFSFEFNFFINTFYKYFLLLSIVYTTQVLGTDSQCKIQTLIESLTNINCDSYYKFPISGYTATLGNVGVLTSFSVSYWINFQNISCDQNDNNPTYSIVYIGLTGGKKYSFLQYITSKQYWQLETTMSSTITSNLINYQSIMYWNEWYYIVQSFSLAKDRRFFSIYLPSELNFGINGVYFKEDAYNFSDTYLQKDTYISFGGQQDNSGYANRITGSIKKINLMNHYYNIEFPVEFTDATVSVLNLFYGFTEGSGQIIFDLSNNLRLGTLGNLYIFSLNFMLRNLVLLKGGSVIDIKNDPMWPPITDSTSVDGLNFFENSLVKIENFNMTGLKKQWIINFWIKFQGEPSPSCNSSYVFSKQKKNGDYLFAIKIKNSAGVYSDYAIDIYNSTSRSNARPSTSYYTLMTFVFSLVNQRLDYIVYINSTIHESIKSLEFPNQFLEEITDIMMLGSSMCSFIGYIKTFQIFTNSLLVAQTSCLPLCSFTIGYVTPTCLWYDSIDLCSDPEYFDTSVGQCLGCNLLCNQCSGSSINCGDSCADGFYLNKDILCGCKSGNNFWNTSGKCCPDMHYYDMLKSTCIICPIGCTSCLNSTYCTDCLPEFYINPLNNLCISPCLDGYFPSNKSCVICDVNCGTCSEESTKCTSCHSTFFLDYSIFYCFPCDTNCTECFGMSTNCTECSNGYYLTSQQNITDMIKFCAPGFVGAELWIDPSSANVLYMKFNQSISFKNQIGKLKLFLIDIEGFNNKTDFLYDVYKNSSDLLYIVFQFQKTISNNFMRLWHTDVHYLVDINGNPVLNLEYNITLSYYFILSTNNKEAIQIASNIAKYIQVIFGIISIPPLLISNKMNVAWISFDALQTIYYYPFFGIASMPLNFWEVVSNFKWTSFPIHTWLYPILNCNSYLEYNSLPNNATQDKIPIEYINYAIPYNTILIGLYGLSCIMPFINSALKRRWRIRAIIAYIESRIRWNLPIRFIMITLLPTCYYLFLQLTNFDKDDNSHILGFAIGIVNLIAILGCFLGGLFLLTIKLEVLGIGWFSKHVSCLFQDPKDLEDLFLRNFEFLLLFRKILFGICLTVFYKSPSGSLIVITLTNILNIQILKYFEPYYIKGFKIRLILQEYSLIFMNICMITSHWLLPNDDNNLIIGWIIILFALVIILSSFLYMAYYAIRQWKKLYIKISDCDWTLKIKRSSSSNY